MTLDEHTVDPNPIKQFEKWFDEAREARLPEPHAMAMATADRSGRPSVRMVYLKGVDERGFLFYTNYESRKGRELAENPWASLAFHWVGLERQIRIDGSVSKTSPEESDAYYDSRPLDSQLSVWALRQSEIISDRAALDRQFEEAREKFKNGVNRPPHWGGYRIRPTQVEFWQGRENPLHDRLCYLLQPDGDWKIVRLTP
jgi:pyridoxamine 5'-phosphate oxidase